MLLWRLWNDSEIGVIAIMCHFPGRRWTLVTAFALGTQPSGPLNTGSIKEGLKMCDLSTEDMGLYFECLNTVTPTILLFILLWWSQGGFLEAEWGQLHNQLQMSVPHRRLDQPAVTTAPPLVQNCRLVTNRRKTKLCKSGRTTREDTVGALQAGRPRKRVKEEWKQILT